MQQFFLRPAKSRLLLAITFTALVCVVVAAFISIDSHARWKDALEQYQSVTPSKMAICKDLEREVQTLARNWRAIEPQIFSNDCPIGINPYSSRDVPTLNFPIDPGSQLQWFAKEIDIGKIFFFISFVLIVSWMTTQIIHDLLKIEHQGWKRLFIVISIIAMIISIWKFRDEYSRDFVPHLLINILVLIITAAALVYGRMIFTWVAEGFSKHQPTVSRAEPIPTLDIRSTVKVTKPIHQERQGVVMVAPLSKPANLERLPFATYWPRFWARCIDLFLVVVIANIISIFIPDLPIPPGVGAIIMSTITWMILLSIVIVTYDKFLIQKFGATPGKVAFGLQVRSLKRGGLLTSSQAQGRALSHLKSGLYFMIYFPVFQFIGAISAWRKRNEPMPWDREANSVVLQKTIGQFRYLSFALISLVMILSVITADMIFKQIRKSEVRRSAVESLK